MHVYNAPKVYLSKEVFFLYNQSDTSPSIVLEHTSVGVSEIYHAREQLEIFPKPFSV